MKVIAKKPNNCSGLELNSFLKLVSVGNEVNTNGLQNRILDAEQLFFIYENEQCVGISAVKCPQKSYITSIFKEAGALVEEKYEYELGWVYVLEDKRKKGYGAILTMSACHHLSEKLPDKACYSTVREDNTKMRNLLEQFGFKRLGNSYESKRGGYFIVLYVKNNVSHI
ncbi:GNAT family N-acetyltransferase [Providencia rettgeri]|uniref:GNAT family N-acetyltransferase n=1 Tax=Providencia rettgeri TaxID=587 RepID=UPI002893DEC1|nr:GNAT family N-acetyltransferase [Providencia rettgeri]ELM3936164.1 GNAT family N-acetyltransferase [Providencia rettgeri]EMA4643915.1 GNAT family N-acetyltransferase [Providencia rettgeri]WRR95379.1 GNAT family N-acetyltransferase [Providencia rettgeri]